MKHNNESEKEDVFISICMKKYTSNETSSFAIFNHRAHLKNLINQIQFKQPSFIKSFHAKTLKCSTLWSNRVLSFLSSLQSMTDH